MAETLKTEFENYLATLAISHINVKHTDGGQCSFSKLLTDESLSQITNNPGRDVILVVAGFSGRAVGEMDTLKMRQTCSIYFAAYCAHPADGNMPTAISTALDKAYVVMLDFLAKIIKDYVADQCGALRFIDPQNASWDLIPEQPWLENHFGWELVLPFGAKLPAYDAAKWA